MNGVISMLRDVPDPRTGNATRHSLLDVLTIALVASISGCESCVDFADFAEDREDLFREFLELSHGLPSHDTFSRLFRLLDPEALSRCFGRFLDHVGTDGSGVLAVDGKTLRRSFDRAAGTSPLHVVTAFAADARLVLGHRAMAAGENEIVAARALLGCLDLGGTPVTADAIHCQRDTAAAVLERGGDYLFSLKDNRSAMLADVEAFFAAPDTLSLLNWHETVDADHGRVERRRHATTQDVAWLFSDRRYAGEPAVPDLTTTAVVDSTVERDGQTSRSRRYYLSSTCLAPERQAVRSGQRPLGPAETLDRGTDHRVAEPLPASRKDWESLSRKALEFPHLASIRLMLRRLCRTTICDPGPTIRPAVAAHRWCYGLGDAGFDAVDPKQAKPVDRPSQLACADAVVTTQGIEALRRQCYAPRLGNGDLHPQERAPDTVAIKARRSASISSGSSNAAKCPPRGMSVQCTTL